jgi:hypothetical protein
MRDGKQYQDVAKQQNITWQLLIIFKTDLPHMHCKVAGLPD